LPSSGSRDAEDRKGFPRWGVLVASREFTDDRGDPWQVWAVEPDSLERRVADDPLLRPAVERRVRMETRVKVTNPLMADGWLTFEGRMERRRLAPIPAGWSEMDENALRELLANAISAASAQRLLE